MSAAFDAAEDKYDALLVEDAADAVECLAGGVVYSCDVPQIDYKEADRPLREGCVVDEIPDPLLNADNRTKEELPGEFDDEDLTTDLVEVVAV